MVIVAGEMSRREFVARFLRWLTILKIFLLTLSSHVIGLRGVRYSPRVRSFGFQDDRLKSWDRTSSRWGYGRRWLDLVYVRLHRFELELNDFPFLQKNCAFVSELFHRSFTHSLKINFFVTHLWLQRSRSVTFHARVLRSGDFRFYLFQLLIRDSWKLFLRACE